MVEEYSCLFIICWALATVCHITCNLKDTFENDSITHSRPSFLISFQLTPLAQNFDKRNKSTLIFVNTIKSLKERHKCKRNYFLVMFCKTISQSNHTTSHFHKITSLLGVNSYQTNITLKLPFYTQVYEYKCCKKPMILLYLCSQTDTHP